MFLFTFLGNPYSLEIYDTQSDQAYDNIRPEIYPGTDVFIVCFSVARLASKQNVLDKWLPEIRRFQPVTPFLLVGTHIEWRELWDENVDRPVYTSEGQQLAEKIGAMRYMECSMTSQGDGVKHVFEEAIRVSIMDPMELSQQLPDFERTGATLLHKAALANHVPAVLSLVDIMDINVRDKLCHTPLDTALGESNVEAIRALVTSGSEIATQTEGWKRRCEFWGTYRDEYLMGENLEEFSRQLSFLYVSLGKSANFDSWNVLLIGHPGPEVAKFLKEIASSLKLKSLIIMNCEGPCAFEFARFVPSLESLVITNCDMGSDLPDSVYCFENLVSLSLVKTNIVRLSDRLASLKNLQRLRLSGNKLRHLPDSIGRLQQLRFLHCGFNLLENIPDPVGCLGNLEVLDLTQNKLEKLSASLGLLGRLRSLKYSRNKLKFPPTHVLNRGREAVLEFLGAFLDDPVANRQVKLTVVGGESVGKSTLVKAMDHKKDWRMSSVDPPDKTEGTVIWYRAVCGGGVGFFLGGGGKGDKGSGCFFFPKMMESKKIWLSSGVGVVVQHATCVSRDLGK